MIPEEDIGTLHRGCSRTRFTPSNKVIVKKCTDTVWKAESGLCFMLLSDY